MMSMMMIDDIRVEVTVMIDTASRTQGEMPKKTKDGDTQHSLADLAVSDQCLSHVAKSDVAVDKLSSVNSQADHRYSFVPRPSRRLASRATPTEVHTMSLIATSHRVCRWM